MASSDFATMEETARLIKKSYGSVRLIVKKLRENNNFDKYCKKDGKQVLISVDYLRQNYDIEESSDEVEFLKEQLRERNETIAHLLSQRDKTDQERRLLLTMMKLSKDDISNIDKIINITKQIEE